MKNLLVILLFILVGCLPGEETVDISDLTTEHRILFAGAAAREGIEVSTSERPWYWKVVYAEIEGYGAYASVNDIGICKIEIDMDKLFGCSKGGINQEFFSISRHELRHCQGQTNHVSDPDMLMYEFVPCWPID